MCLQAKGRRGHGWCWELDRRRDPVCGCPREQTNVRVWEKENLLHTRRVSRTC